MYEAGFEASNAVDGNQDDWTTSGPIGMTEPESEPWWEVDLGARFLVEGVNVFHRFLGSITVSDYDVLIADAPFGSMSLAEARLAATWSTAMAAPADESIVQISVPQIAGQYVRIQGAGAGVLPLGEVDVIGTPSNLPPFGTPSNVQLETNGTDEVTIRWDPVANVKGYLVHRDFQFVGFVGPQTTTLVDRSVTQGETYRYQVRAQASDDTNSPPSPLKSITVLDDGEFPPFGTPANAVLSTNGVDQVTISWEPVADAKGYLIHRDFEYVGFVPFTQSTWVDTNVVTGQTYRYQVRAQADDNSNSQPSAIQSIGVGNDVVARAPERASDSRDDGTSPFRGTRRPTTSA